MTILKRTNGEIIAKGNESIRTLVEANKSRLHGADLRGADLCEADLIEANLAGADLRGAQLCRADLWGADLCRADLHGANLEWAYLHGVSLEKAGGIIAVGPVGPEGLIGYIVSTDSGEPNIRLGDFWGPLEKAAIAISEAYDAASAAAYAGFLRAAAGELATYY